MLTAISIRRRCLFALTPDEISRRGARCFVRAQSEASEADGRPDHRRRAEGWFRTGPRREFEPVQRALTVRRAQYLLQARRYPRCDSWANPEAVYDELN